MAQGPKNGNGNGGGRVPPMVPNPGGSDLSQPNADEVTQDEAARRAEEMRSLVQRDLARDRDERFRIDDPNQQDHSQQARGDDGRDEDLDMARGGDRAYSQEQW